MSIASELNRLLQAKSDLATAITNKGVTVPANATLDDYAALVDSIQTGGGGGSTLPYDAEIEYITNTGTQIIDTGIDLVDGTTEVKLVFKVAFSATQYNNQSLLVACSTPTLGVQIYTYRTDRLVNQTSEKTISLNTQYIVTTVSTATQRSIQLGTGTATSKSVSISISDGSRLYLLSSPSFAEQARSARASYYYFNIYINNNIVREYIPVRKGSVGYLYDKVSGELFGNNGSGSFTLGPDVI